MNKTRSWGKDHQRETSAYSIADVLRQDALTYTDPLAVILAGVILRLEDVEERADALIDVHWNSIRDENERRTNLHERSRIGTRKRSRNGTITLEWFHSTIYKHEGEYKTRWTHIEKPRGTSYNLNTLRKYCAGWEVDLVADTEERFRELRKEIAELLRIRRSIKSIRTINGSHSTPL